MAPRVSFVRVRTAFVDLSRMVFVEAPEAAAAPMPKPRVPRERVAAARAQRVREESLTPHVAGELPRGWLPPAECVGAAIRDTVRERWHDCYLALAGALCERGCPLESVADVVARAHLVDPAWASLLDDRTTIARTTVARFEADSAYTGYLTLRAEFPSVAAALDTHTVTHPEAYVLRQLAVPGPEPMPVEEAVALIERTMRAPSGVVLIEAPPGTGKTQAVVRVAADLPPIPVGVNARPGQRMAVSTPTHKLAKQTAAQARRSISSADPTQLISSAAANPACQRQSPTPASITRRRRQPAYGGQALNH